MNLSKDDMLNKFDEINDNLTLDEDKQNATIGLFSNSSNIEDFIEFLKKDKELYDEIKTELFNYINGLVNKREKLKTNEIIIIQSYLSIYYGYNFQNFEIGYLCEKTNNAIDYELIGTKGTQKKSQSANKINQILLSYEKALEGFETEINKFNQDSKEYDAIKIGGTGGISYLDVSEKIEGKAKIFPIGLQKQINNLYYNFVSDSNKLVAENDGVWLKSRINKINKRFENIIGKNMFGLYIKNILHTNINDPIILLELTNILKYFYLKNQPLFEKNIELIIILSEIKINENDILNAISNIKNIYSYLEKEFTYPANVLSKIIEISITLVKEPTTLDGQKKCVFEMTQAFSKLVDNFKSNYKTKSIARKGKNQLEEPPVETVSRNAKHMADTINIMFGEEVKGILGII